MSNPQIDVRPQSLEFIGKGYLVTLGQYRLGNWAFVRLARPSNTLVPIRFQLVTGGRKPCIVFDEPTNLDPPNLRSHGALIRLPESLAWEHLQSLYVVVRKRGSL